MNLTVDNEQMTYYSPSQLRCHAHSYTGNDLQFTASPDTSHRALNCFLLVIPIARGEGLRRHASYIDDPVPFPITVSYDVAVNFQMLA